MKRLFTIFATFAMLCAVGCEEQGDDNVNPNDKPGTEQPGDPKPENIFFGLDKERVSISPDGGSVDVVVYSNYKWEISGKSDWCTPSVTSGEANEDGQKVTFSADVTYDTREAIFWFRCADEKIKLVVSQNLKEVIIADENNTFSVSSEGGNVIINYQTSVECEVIIPEEAQSWISFAPAETRGLVSESATLTVAENTTYSERSAVVKVVAANNNELVAEYTITQQSQLYFIEYTSTNGSTVTPYNSSALGATIIRNEYIDGKGYIEFDAPITSIGDSAFGGCTSLTSITIPDSVTSIGDDAFRGCSSLTSISIPDSVTKIGGYAFSYCTSLTNVTIGDSVTSIGEWAFFKCTSLTSITIPDCVTEIGDFAFDHCTSLTSVTIGNGVTSIGQGAFGMCSSLAEVYCKPTTPPIGGYNMFNYNASGRKIYVPTESVRAYKAAEWWSDYADAIVGYDFE